MAGKKLTELGANPQPLAPTDLMYVVQDGVSYKTPIADVVLATGNVTSDATSTTANEIAIFSDTSGETINKSAANVNSNGDAQFRSLSFGVGSSPNYPGLTIRYLTSTQLADPSTTPNLNRGTLVGNSSSFDRPRYYHSDGSTIVHDDIAYLSDITAGGGNVTNVTIPSVNNEFVVYDGTSGTSVKSAGFGPSNVAITGGTINSTVIGNVNPVAAAFSTVDINSGTIDNAQINNTVIGDIIPAAGSFSNATISAGTINGTIIGNYAPSTGTFTTANISSANISGGSINGTLVGAGTPSYGGFSYVDVNSGVINNTTIGQTTPAAGTFTTLTASTLNFSGANGNVVKRLAMSGSKIMPNPTTASPQSLIIGASSSVGSWTIPANAINSNYNLDIYSYGNIINITSGNGFVFYLYSSAGLLMTLTGNSTTSGSPNDYSWGISAKSSPTGTRFKLDLYNNDIDLSVADSAVTSLVPDVTVSTDIDIRFGFTISSGLDEFSVYSSVMKVVL